MTALTKTLLAIALLGAGALLWALLSTWYARVRFRHRMRQGARGEERARSALERLGFTIIREQPELTATMWLDGEEKHYTVRVDYMVARKGVRGIVEVKTGKKATDPLYAPTRRQIFEYAHLYDVEKIWFMNGDTLELTEVSFTAGRRDFSSSGTWRWVLRVGFALALLGGLVYLLRSLSPV